MSGYIDAALYVIIASVTFVLLTKISSTIDPVVSLFFLSATALVCFNFLGFKSFTKTYKAMFANLPVSITMSMALGLDWVFMLFASINSDPFIAMGTIFITLAILGFINLFKTTHKVSYLFSICILFFCMVLLAVFYNIVNYSHKYLGISFGILAGISFYFYIVYSNKLSKKANMNPIQILSLRFWALFIGSIFFLPDSTMFIIRCKFIELVTISIFSLVIPIFFNQRALQKLGPDRASVFFCLVPPTTYIFYSIFNNTFIFINILICIMITTALVIPKLLEIKDKYIQ
ncbi:MAG: EamA family transporter [Neisseriaceae bacterium]